ncbi:MAG: hypothetical protein WB791_10460 [Waddliaceae bacterium]
MPRLAVTKQPSKSRRYAVRKVAPKKARVAKKASPAKSTRREPQTLTKPMHLARIETLLDHLKTYANERLEQLDPSDKIAKKLQQLHTAISREMKKKNAINPQLAKHLKQIASSLKGASKVPAALRNHAPKLKSFLREQVKKDVTNYINTMKKSITSLQKEFTTLENKLKQEVKNGKTHHIQFKADPAILRKKMALKNNFAQFKNKWYKRLNPLILQAPKNMQQSIRTFKKQMEDLQKTCQRTCTLVSRYAKPIKKPKPGFHSQTLFTQAQAIAMENKISQFQKNLESQAPLSNHFLEQLKAIKQF